MGYGLWFMGNGVMANVLQEIMRDGFNESGSE